MTIKNAKWRSETMEFLLRIDNFQYNYVMTLSYQFAAPESDVRMPSLSSTEPIGHDRSANALAYSLSYRQE